MADNKNKKEVNKVDNDVIDYSKISNEEIKNYIRDIELRREKEYLLRERLKSEDNKIDILNQNISKLVMANSSLEDQAADIRGSTTSLSGEIAALKMELEKAEAESKLKRVKQIKSDILINAKILQDQEDTIDKLRKKREEIRQQQEAQRDILLSKREEIEKIKNQTVQNEFQNLDEELVDIIQSTLTNNADKTQIMSAALQEVSAEMKKIKALEALNKSKTTDNIELLKTQMLELNNIANPGTNDNPLQTIKNAQAIAKPKTSISQQRAVDIEAKTILIGKLDKLVNEGLITNEDKERELERFNYNNSLDRSHQSKFGYEKNKKKEKAIKNKIISQKNGKWSKNKIVFVFLLILLQLGIIALIVLFAIPVAPFKFN